METLTLEEALKMAAVVPMEPFGFVSLFEPMTEEQIVEAATKCHECTMADYGIGSHKHCGMCYCCKT